MATSADLNSFTFDSMSGMDDMDSYFDFSQGEFQPSPVQTRPPVGKLDASSASNTDTMASASGSIDPQQMMRLHSQQQQQHQQQQASEQQRQQQYNGPSHEYGRFRQQTGFPSGAIANVAALNDLPPAGPFGARYNLGGNYNSGIDLSNDFGEGPSQGFLPTDSFDEFVDPSAIDSQPAPTPARLFPGAHSQQAQLQQQRQIAASKQPAPVQGRQPSLTERSDSPTPTVGESNLAKLAKVDEDMDEDERLLASEEGKKLSSKERRQLRNKVSARAFRSRRKEYISQLEGEVAVKIQEATDLKTRVRQLEEQNNQLQQLTRMLLGHPAFSQVMNDMSNDPNILAPVKQVQQQQQQQQQQQEQRSQDNQQDNVFVGMSMIPETNLDFSTLNLGGNSSNNRQSRQWFQQQQVFAVHAISQGPSIEELQTSRLSDKPVIPELPRLDGKSDSTFVAPAKRDAPAPVTTVENPAFELYDALPSRPATSSSQLTLTDAARMLENSLSGKVPVHFRLSTVISGDDATISESLDNLFAPAESLCERLELASSVLHL